MNRTTACIAEAVGEYMLQPERAAPRAALLADAPLEQANETFSRLTGVTGFFPDQAALAAFQSAVLAPDRQASPPRVRQWGDFQTPPGLAARVCHYLADSGVSPRIIIEPTCGEGHFVLAALEAFPAAELVYGVEIQEKHLWRLKLALLERSWRGQPAPARIELRQDDIFAHRFPDHVLQGQDILIIGNPPWVTSAELGALESENRPARRNIKAFGGLDALTGKSNFDLGEYILLRMLDLFSERRGVLAMLCKNAVIKNLVEALPQRRSKVARIRALAIDARREFGAAVDASLLALELGAPRSMASCQVASLEHPEHVTQTFGWVADKFVADIAGYRSAAGLDGVCPWVWRQGLKHDCAAVMELQESEGRLINGEGEPVNAEADWLYGLLKGSDLRTFQAALPRRKVIVPQRMLGEDTTGLQMQAPNLWDYLEHHAAALDGRKSSIYLKQPRFAIFGIGDYSFKPFKVAISGLHKTPCFSLALPETGRPVMLDDTCYFLGFDTYAEALWTASALNSKEVARLLASITFPEAKRPFTKEVLMRIDLARAVTEISFGDIVDSWISQGFRPPPDASESSYDAYRRRVMALGDKDQTMQLNFGI